jgi:hypothetical protein
MKLATWNLRLPLSDPRRKTMRSHTDREQADVWVLTETDDSFTLIPGHPFHCSSAGGCDGQGANQDHWVTIWSRHPLERLATSDDIRTAAARVTPDSGDPFVVYGTVLPWLGSKWGRHPSAGGVAFREALRIQATDWMRIKGDYRRDEFFVLGDFNQDLVSPPHYYGSQEYRAELRRVLDDSGLVALTAEDRDPV